VGTLASPWLEGKGTHGLGGLIRRIVGTIPCGRPGAHGLGGLIRRIVGTIPCGRPGRLIEG